MTAVLPGGTIGIVGGGQIGRMLVLEGRRMGYRFCVLDPDARSPGALVSGDCIEGALSDEVAALELADRAAVVTLDTELIPAEVLEKMEAKVPVRPRAATLRTLQDRLAQKEFLARHGFPQTKYRSVADANALAPAFEAVGSPAVLKARKAGHDGKGQATVEAGADPAATFAKAGGVPAILESLAKFRMEIAVVLARGEDGHCEVYPIAENIYWHRILHTTRAPARISPAVATKATEMAKAIAAALDNVGVMVVELFLFDDDSLLVNEIAPRPQNAGHYTFGACATSQFEQHVRAICGLPLGDPSALSPAVTMNLVGDLWHNGRPDWTAALSDPHVHLHLYGKAMAVDGRKMGHLLVLDRDTDSAMRRAEAILAKLEEDAGLQPDARRT